MSWSDGLTILSIGKGSVAYQLDFAALVSTKTVTVNGLRVDASTDKYFTDVVRKFQNAIHTRKNASILNAIVPSAAADDNDPLAAVFGSMAYWTGLDQLAACTISEGVTITECAFRSNASMIRSALDKGDRLTGFQCGPNGISSVSVQCESDTVNLKLVATYARSGQVASYETFQDGDSTCKYSMRNGQLTGVTVNGFAGSDYCNGRTVGDYESQLHSFSRGDRAHYIATFPFSLQRLQKCCSDVACKKDITGLANQPAPQPFIQKSNSVK